MAILAYLGLLFLVPLFAAKESLGFGTLLLSHVTFCLPYVILNVLPRINELGNSLTEAALDLGCTPVQAFFKVKLPNIMPGVLSGMVMAFTMSLDDFVISHFVSSPDFKTLPLYIYNQTAHEVKFSMYALCSLIIAVILVLMLTINFVGAKTDEKRTPSRKVKTEQRKLGKH